jgi:hypothetical protein
VIGGKADISNDAAAAIKSERNGKRHDRDGLNFRMIHPKAGRKCSPCNKFPRAWQETFRVQQIPRQLTDVVIHVYDPAGNWIEAHEHKGDLKGSVS